MEVEYLIRIDMNWYDLSIFDCTCWFCNCDPLMPIASHWVSLHRFALRLLLGWPSTLQQFGQGKGRFERTKDWWAEGGARVLTSSLVFRNKLGYVWHHMATSCYCSIIYDNLRIVSNSIEYWFHMISFFLYFYHCTMLCNLYLDIWWYVWNCVKCFWICDDLWICLRFSLLYCLAKRLCRSGPSTTLSSRSIPTLLRNQLRQLRLRLRLRRRRIQQASPNPQECSTMCVLDKSGNVGNIPEMSTNLTEFECTLMIINDHSLSLIYIIEIIIVHQWYTIVVNVQNVFRQHQYTHLFMCLSWLTLGGIL